MTVCMSAYAITSIDHIITFFIRTYPLDEESEQQHMKEKEASDKLQQTLATPGKLAFKLTKASLPDSNTGIFITYQGYLVVTSLLGQVTLPRLTQQPSLKILVTEKIDPVMMIGNTIHHWEISPNVPAQMYSLERKEDPETKLLFWHYEQTSLPENNIIPLNTIVILTKPKNIIIPSGITLSTNDQQWILPNIYVRKSISSLEPALSVLRVRQFFGPINIVRKKASDTNYATQISTP